MMRQWLLIGSVLCSVIYVGQSMPAIRALRKRITQEQCKQSVAGFQKSKDPHSLVEVNPTCQVGSVAFQYSRGDLKLSFWREYPYQVCFIDLIKFTVESVTNKLGEPVKVIKDGNNICIQEKASKGGTMNVMLKPKTFSYISQIFYEVHKLKPEVTTTESPTTTQAPKRGPMRLPVPITKEWLINKLPKILKFLKEEKKRLGDSSHR